MVAIGSMLPDTEVYKGDDMSETVSLGVMISGSATTFEACCLNIAANELPIEPRLLIADRPTANLQVAERINKLLGWDIKPVLIDRASFPGGATERSWDMTDDQSEALLGEVQAAGVTLLSQQGWLSRTRGVLLETFGQKPEHTQPEQSALLNNHPGITADTPGLWGKGVHQRAAELGRTAFTMHTVSDGYDEGFVWAEHPVPVLPGDTADQVERSVQAVEKAMTAHDILAFARARTEAYIDSLRTGIPFDSYNS